MLNDPQPELDSIQLTLNYMQTALISEHPVLNSVYPKLNVADNKTNFCIVAVSSDDVEYKDEDDDVNDNGNHLDILFAKRCGTRRI